MGLSGGWSWGVVLDLLSCVSRTVDASSNSLRRYERVPTDACACASLVEASSSRTHIGVPVWERKIIEIPRENDYFRGSVGLTHNANSH